MINTIDICPSKSFKNSIVYLEIGSYFFEIDYVNKYGGLGYKALSSVDFVKILSEIGMPVTFTGPSEGL